MPSLRRSRYLTCFYCGRKTSTRNDGSVRHFECPSCDATNYLDENGEITDPPLEATAASIRSDPKPSFGSPASEPSSDVFCSTCLKNQRIFTSSLAQYLPDDPDDPEYEERERNFYKYRKGLEKQYPQVCAQCEPKVLQRITKAGYTAKTDHLRRMIDHSRKERTPTAATSLLGGVGALGRYLWLAGFVLQALWHASIMRGLTGQYQVPVVGGAWGRWVLDAVVDRLFSALPGPERLMKWSIAVTAASIWWNPFLVQTVRGFTKHLLGFSTWYTYQVIIMLLRILALTIPGVSAQKASEVPTQLAAHTFMLGFVFFISRLSLGAIRTDTTPLFATSPKRSLVVPPESTPQRARDDEPASLAEILDDVLATPSAPALDLSPSPIIRSSESATRHTGRYFSPPSAVRRPLWEQGNGFAREPATPPSRDPFAAPQEPQSVQYETEMDWTPTQSKHRAFRSFGSPEEPLRGFGQTPAEGGDHRQFWFKVPPAPTSIAQRALNPPTAARLRKQPPVERSLVFGPSLSSQGPATSGEDRHDVAFKEPSFFAETSSDPRNTLSDLFGQAFTISPSKTQTIGGRRGSGAGGSGPISPPARWGSLSDMALLAVSGMLLIPGYATLVPPEYGSHLALGVCCLTFVVWAKVSLGNLKGLLLWATAKTGRRPWVLTAAVGSLIGLAELGVAARIAFECYTEDRWLVTHRAQDNWLVLVLVLHQLWNAFLGPLVQHKLTGGGVQVRR
ncbi:hypothetical protein RB594_006552 [Gaeumannomyces avenae]